ncbi:NADPH-dependent FMN reductase [Streptomyces hygroscopicus]|uniref:NADPH-dependent FMN reductase n=1 Tax=Streptomyces hygroscopicus TaxID=1912 RepID=UPI001FCBF4B0|nr:NAD(P)H-dependent oxidoreductase [Streptomyces hygroscopicus]BDH13435.1 FMN reductase [Streptomyces hygroscopicus]
MSQSPIKLAVITGSVREERFGPTVANWFMRQAESHGEVRAELIDLVDHPLPLTQPAPGRPAGPQVQAVRERLAAKLADAEAFVVVTPEYNHTIAPSLTNAISWFFDEWAAKPVGLVSYGGMGGGLRAAEHLRQVFAELHAMTVRGMVSFHNAWDQFASDGEPVSPRGSEVAAKVLLDQLVWWANPLREAREKVPYRR